MSMFYLLSSFAYRDIVSLSRELKIQILCKKQPSKSPYFIRIFKDWCFNELYFYEYIIAEVIFNLVKWINKLLVCCISQVCKIIVQITLNIFLYTCDCVFSVPLWWIVLRSHHLLFAQLYVPYKLWKINYLSYASLLHEIELRLMQYQFH